MYRTLATVTEQTTGELISTTDIKEARLLGQRLTVRELIRGRLARFELVDGGVVIYAGRELYELRTA